MRRQVSVAAVQTRYCLSRAGRSSISAKLRILVFLGLLQTAVIPSVAFAEGTCGRNTVIVPDGRITQSTIPANTTFWYNVSPANPGRSYSVEFRSVIDRPPTAPFTLLVTTNCSGSLYPGVRNTNTIDPGVQAGGGQRRSFIVSAENPVVMFSFTNPNDVAMTYTFSVSETTMFSTSWRFTDHGPTLPNNEIGLVTAEEYAVYIFTNTTKATIMGTLTFQQNGFAKQVTLTPNILLNPITNFEDPVVGVNSVKFVHNGPPGAILVDAYVRTDNYTVSGSTRTFKDSIVRSIKFEAPRESR